MLLGANAKTIYAIFVNLFRIFWFHRFICQLIKFYNNDFQNNRAENLPEFYRSLPFTLWINSCKYDSQRPHKNLDSRFKFFKGIDKTTLDSWTALSALSSVLLCAMLWLINQGIFTQKLIWFSLIKFIPVLDAFGTDFIIKTEVSMMEVSI